MEVKVKAPRGTTPTINLSSRKFCVVNMADTISFPNDLKQVVEQKSFDCICFMCQTTDLHPPDFKSRRRLSVMGTSSYEWGRMSSPAPSASYFLFSMVTICFHSNFNGWRRVVSVRHLNDLGGQIAVQRRKKKELGSRLSSLLFLNVVILFSFKLFL